MNHAALILAAALTTAMAPIALHAEVAHADVTRGGADALTLDWADPNPVDLYESDRPNFALKDAKKLAHATRDGHYVVQDAGNTRHYFALVDTRDQHRLDTAERLVPLLQGSNFRDIGGYPAAGGKHVRWGMVYRSGASAMLSDSDVRNVKSLGLSQTVDLRSSEERALAPSRIEGVPYTAVGYSMASLAANLNAPGVPQNGGAVYRNFPTMLAPQIRVLFADLLANSGPIAYNCSAGQDRTGFVTALILSALGVPRDVIIADYHLSTRYRQPQYEMPKIDPVAQANNPTALYFAKFQQNPAAAKPQPLMDADGKPFIAYAFEAIEARWGSVDNYLYQEAGVDQKALEKLRKIYLQ